MLKDEIYFSEGLIEAGRRVCNPSKLNNDCLITIVLQFQGVCSLSETGATGLRNQTWHELSILNKHLLNPPSTLHLARRISSKGTL